MPDPAPHQKVNTKTKLAMTPGRAKRQPPQSETHIILDVTEVIQPDTNPYDGSNFKVPLVHRYNARARLLKGHNIIANDMTKILMPIKMPTPTPTITTVLKTGEKRVHTNSTTGEVTIRPGLTNNVICPEIGKYQ